MLEDEQGSDLPEDKVQESLRQQQLQCLQNARSKISDIVTISVAVIFLFVDNLIHLYPMGT